ncbi:flagellar export protein FliJ [Tahibacter soli]|uniref:Flagellar FliJ protein n=1 Tax=Tahibacter soli TaxID=2983605 RepID=A0A9X4BJ45_9GAMM|nr:flagellar export protein FliJ [Tahibacter soli]MDC8012867.1 flagellar export protein FliJ [Tahibacter soli]
MNSRRLKTIRQLADLREREQARRYAAEQRVAEAQARRLDDIERYIAEYEGARLGTLAPALLANHLAFVAQLGEAREQQRRQVANAALACEAERGRLVEARRGAAVYERLSDTLAARERAEAESRAQGELDEHGQHPRTPTDQRR